MLTINSTENIPGRFCNHFFRNMMAHILAEKNNLSMKYHEYKNMKRLGLDLYVEGAIKNTSITPLIIEDNNFMQYIVSDTLLNQNISVHVNRCFCQTREFAFLIQDYFYKHKWFDNIMRANKFRDHYNNNDNIFIHVRLGDVAHLNPGFDYYDQCISRINETRNLSEGAKGYISSDSIDHPICRQLIEKHGLVIVQLDEVDTIHFASTCRNLILSQGTFSWTIGFLGMFSTRIFYPKIHHEWHGDVFVFPHWTEVEWKNEKSI
jgi:hypothetical protein